MMFEDNVGEDGLSAESSYNDTNYIDNLAPDPTMFDNEVLLEHDTLQKVYTKLIEALNEVQIKKQVQPYLYCGMENHTTLVLIK